MNESWNNWISKNLVHTYKDMGDSFYNQSEPTPLKNIELVHFNTDLAKEIGFDSDLFLEDQTQEFFNSTLKFDISTPLSTVYSGHQFGQWAGQLGDSRAHLLGELKNDHNHYDLQLKGAGLTAYSRRGDGRAVWRSSLREYLASEAMQGLGIATSRALALWDSEEEIYRETVESGALVLRAGECFVRFGTFEHFYSNKDHHSLQKLFDYSLKRWYADLNNSKTKVKDFITEVSKQTSQLMAHWMGVGFCHGVMNTDNMAINGDTIDYGPYGFMDYFDYYHICNHSDNQGRYKYGDQPGVALWNLFRLRDALEPLMSDKDFLKEEELREEFTNSYQDKTDLIWGAKLGVKVQGDALHELMSQTFKLLHKNHIDWTDFWRSLSHSDKTGNTLKWNLWKVNPNEAQTWFDLYIKSRAQGDDDFEKEKQSMLKTNPKFILRNHLAQRLIAVEGLDKRREEIDLFLKLLKSPFEEHPGFEEWSLPPVAAEKGFIPSCSS